MEDLLRFEPYYGSYLFSQEGEIYAIDKLPSDEDLNNCFITDRKDMPIPYNGLTAPIKVQIQYTNGCNFNCPACYVSSGKTLSGEMSEKEIKDILLKLKDFGVLQIEWSGGEVFTRKNFLGVVAYAQELGFEQTVLTNGYAIGKLYKDTSFLWDLFTRIQISIDGYGENFNKWTGITSWDYVKVAVENLYYSKPEHASFCVTTTLDKRNLGDLKLIAEWVNGKDILWKLGKQVSVGRSYVHEKDSLEILDFSYHEILKLRSQFVLNSIHPYDKTEETNSMFPVEWITEIGARWFMYIKANGDVYPFPYWDGTKSLMAGNILDIPLNDIWYSDAFNLYRSASREKTKCVNCKLVCQMWIRSFNSIDDNLFVTPVSHPNCPLDSIPGNQYY